MKEGSHLSLDGLSTAQNQQSLYDMACEAILREIFVAVAFSN